MLGLCSGLYKTHHQRVSSSKEGFSRTETEASKLEARVPVAMRGDVWSSLSTSATSLSDIGCLSVLKYEIRKMCSLVSGSYSFIQEK